MRPFNPFLQRRRQNVEVILKKCKNCNGSGMFHEDGEEILCSVCSGSGEITEKKITNSTNPKTLPRK